MVTREYIQNIKSTARLWQPYDQAQAEQALRQYLQIGLPDWDPAADSLLSRSIPLLVDVLRVQSETAHAQVRRGLLAFAEGEDLDLIGLGPPPVFRYVGEPDDDYRVRIALAQAGLAIGSLDSIEQNSRLALPAIVSVIAATAPNRQDVSVFACKADCVLLSNAEAASLVEYLNARDRVIAGVQVTAPAPTKVDYNIRVSVRYVAEHESQAALAALVRSALYDFLERNTKLGQPVYRSAIVDAAYLPGVETVTVLEPAYDLAPPELVLKPAAGDTSGQGAIVTARVSPTQGQPIASVQVDAGGTGYAQATTTVTAAGAGGTGAVLTPTIVSGEITAIAVTNGGSGFLAAPSVVITDTGGGTGAAATAEVAPNWTGPITAVDVLDPGGGYSAAPVIEILDGTEGEGAVFTTALGTGDAAGTLASVTISNGGAKWRAGLQHNFCPLYVCPATDAGVIIEMVAI